jgi:hypothetical protein
LAAKRRKKQQLSSGFPFSAFVFPLSAFFNLCLSVPICGSGFSFCFAPSVPLRGVLVLSGFRSQVSRFKFPLSEFRFALIAFWFPPKLAIGNRQLQILGGYLCLSVAPFPLFALCLLCLFVAEVFQDSSFWFGFRFPLSTFPPSLTLHEIPVLTLALAACRPVLAAVDGGQRQPLARRGRHGDVCAAAGFSRFLPPAMD